MPILIGAEEEDAAINAMWTAILQSSASEMDTVLLPAPSYALIVGAWLLGECYPCRWRDTGC